MITVRRIEFKAYGGTGTLIGRSFVTLLALNACNVATDDCKNDVCVIYQMDYDDVSPRGNSTNDARYFRSCIENYQKLNKRGLKFLAPIRLERSNNELKSVRKRAYGAKETEYSLKSLFCRGPHNQEIYELLASAFTTDKGSMAKEIERSNRDGCYGDLAVNGFISERLIATNAFAEEGIYNDLAGYLNDAIVFYAGSTDGGTANTMIDKDIRSLLHYLEDSGKSIDHGRTFRIYGLRTTPYSKFELNGDKHDIEITESILRDKFEMSKGVFDNILHQNNEARNDSIEEYSYFRLDNNQKYWLDGLFVAGSETLDITSKKAMKDNQFHPSHLTELALAMQAMDCIAYRVQPQDGVPCIYGFNDGGGGDDNKNVTLQSFFGYANVNYVFDIYDATYVDGAISFDKYVRAFILTLVTIKGQMISDFRDDAGASVKYISDIFHKCHGDEDLVCPHVANELEAFLDESKFIIMTLMDVMEYSKYKHTDSPVQLMEQAVKYLYDKDIFGNAVEIPAGNGLSIEDGMDGVTRDIEISTNPYFSVLDGMHKIKYHQGGFLGSNQTLKSEELYLNLQGANYEESAVNIANNMIQRTFETYLAYFLA